MSQTEQQYPLQNRWVWNGAIGDEEGWIDMGRHWEGEHKLIAPFCEDRENFLPLQEMPEAEKVITSKSWQIRTLDWLRKPSIMLTGLTGVGSIGMYKLMEPVAQSITYHWPEISKRLPHLSLPEDPLMTGLVLCGAGVVVLGTVGVVGFMKDVAGCVMAEEYPQDQNPGE